MQKGERKVRPFLQADELVRSLFLGHVFENMVIMETVKRLAASPRPQNLYFYRTLKGVEIDLILESGGKIDAYEIKWTQTPDKSMISSLQILSKDLPIQKMDVLAPLESSIPLAKEILAIPWNSEFFINTR